MKPAAFCASYSDLKLIKTRQCVQIVFELPLADFDAAYAVLGGLPDSSQERWFGIAPIKPAKEVITPAAPRTEQKRPDGARAWCDLPPQQQAGMRCGEPAFISFLKENRPDDWREAANTADCVRLICGVVSRSELSTNHKARVIWHQLDEQYQGWLQLERVI
jgi:hypothetical protein